MSGPDARPLKLHAGSDSVGLSLHGLQAVTRRRRRRSVQINSHGEHLEQVSPSEENEQNKNLFPAHPHTSVILTELDFPAEARPSLLLLSVRTKHKAGTFLLSTPPPPLSSHPGPALLIRKVPLVDLPACLRGRAETKTHTSYKQKANFSSSYRGCAKKLC